MNKKADNNTKPENKDIIKRIDEKISTKIRVMIGLVLIAAAVITDVIADYSKDDIVIVLLILGILSIISAIAKLNYIFFMAGNTAATLLYFFIISTYNASGALFLILFSILVFLASWIMEMCLITGASLKKKILLGLLINIIVVIVIVGASTAIITISILNTEIL